MCPQKLSRKLVHITAGPLFVLMWPLFSWAPSARIYAAIIPALNSLRCRAGVSPDLPLATRQCRMALCQVTMTYARPQNCICRLILIGFGIIHSENTVRAVSREGDRCGRRSCLMLVWSATWTWGSSGRLLDQDGSA